MNTRANILKFLVLPTADKVMHTQVMRTYRQIRAMQLWSQKDIRLWQEEKLAKLILHYYHQSPYFRELMEAEGVLPQDIQTVSDMPKLPILSKDDYRKHVNSIVPKNTSQISYKLHSTGGSTGEPLRFRLDHNTWSFVTAHKIFSWERIGYKYGDKVLALGSTSLFPDAQNKSWKHIVYKKLRRYYPRNATNLSNEVCCSYLALMKKERIWFLYGYASAIYLLAKYIENHAGGSFPIQGCFPTSEILTSEYRATIKRVFNCPIMDSYGANDGGVTAFEIRPDRYHVGYNCIVETESHGSSKSGRLLVTDLFNRSFPFIRYEIGDEIKLLDDYDCTYDYNGQVITNIWGRISDILRLENGRVLTGPAFTILFKDLNVNSYRIQKADKMHIRCEIMKAEGYDSVQESLIIGTLKKHAGRDCSVEIVYVSEFELTSSGKRDYFLSNQPG